MQKGVIDGLRKTRQSYFDPTGAVIPATGSGVTMPQPSRYLGATLFGAPSIGTYAVGDYVIETLTGKVYICTAAGSPGVWVNTISSNAYSAKGVILAGTGVGTSAALAVGSDNQALMADATPSTGLIWGNPRSGAEAFLDRTSALTESISRNAVNTVTVALTTQVIFLQAVYLPKNKLITNLGWVSGTTAAGTPTNWWFTLTNNARLTLRSTGDQLTTAWAASTEKVLALSSTFTTTYEGLYYIGVMMKATTPITLQTFAGVATLPALAPILQGASSVGQTVPPADSTTLTAITAAGTPAYCYAT